MGMAASQSRFLQLTASQSNLQFRGQQINQQRTVLASVSASLNSKLLNINVPTPPSSNEFTSNTYSFNMGGTNMTMLVNSIVTSATTGKSTMDCAYSTTGRSGIYSSLDNIYTRYEDLSGNVTYKASIGGQQQILRKLDPNDPNDNIDIQNLCDGRILSKDKNGNYLTIYTYTTEDGINKYVTQADLDNLARKDYDDDPDTEDIDEDYGRDMEGLPIQSYTLGQVPITKTVHLSDVKINYSESGRYASLEVGGQLYNINVSTSNNENAYADAMNEYEYLKAQYDKNMSDINSQLSIIQAQDKKLELELRQLDTENNAINAEMEAIKKVITKNVEVSYKTFNG